MKETSRREFGKRAALTVAALSTGVVSRTAWANPLGLPLGIQLYSVRQQMAEDLDMALAGIQAAGYTEVEAAALPKKTAAEVRSALNRAGLNCVSAHHPFAELKTSFEEKLAYDKELGCTFMICSSPGRRSPAGQAGGGNAHGMTLDDWQYCAEEFNRFAEKTAAAGVMFGYHNHVPEFAVTDGKVPYLELLRLTDPAKVTMELDCGWAKVAGVNPVTLMRDHPHRISMLHVKDFKLPVNPSPDHREDATVTELGMGSVDYQPIFAQASKTQNIKHAFVEQEAFDMPWKQSLKVDAAYLKAMHA